MTWSLPQPDEIAERLAASYEAAFPGATPRDPNTVLGVLSRVPALELFAAHLYLRALADELMPDTAEAWLPRHGDVWGVPRIAAAKAVGSVVFAGTAGLALPSGIALGEQWVTTAAAVLDSGGAATVPVSATVTGTGGNVAAGTVLQLVSPIAGLGVQAATVATGGIAGGAAEEAAEAWRARILARIRDPGHGGSAGDYRRWALAAGAGYVGVYGDWIGAGSVGVVVAMAEATGPRVPTSAELARIAAAIEAERPVTAQVLVLPAVLRAVPITLQVSPDTLAVRAAVLAAIAAHFVDDMGVGTALYRSRLSEAISSASGEYAHRLVAPAADEPAAATEILIPGSITWASWA